MKTSGFSTLPLLLVATSILQLWSATPRLFAQAGPSSVLSITGVFKGNYVCPGRTVGIKLALTGAADQTITGFLIFDLPSDIGPRVAYQLSGKYAWGGQTFSFRATPLGPPAPSAYDVAELKGRYVPGSSMLHGGIPGSPCQDFYLTRDAESPVSVAAEAHHPRATPPARSSAEKEKSAESRATQLAAPPALLASRDLVRKSKAYWSAFHTDIIREVFDGGFGPDVDSDKQFQVLFNSYVETFSQSCRAYLPPHHETLAISQVTTRTNRSGQVTSEERTQSGTIEVDPRFTAKYRRFSQSLISGVQGSGGLGAMMGAGGGVNALFDPGLDADIFFRTETCKSAAMHQFGENLLRGATGHPSLQESGGAIAGAAAESDKSLPPGRFLYLRDACNAFFRDPANSRFSIADADDFCKCLGSAYKNVMTAQEMYFYANDFQGRVQREIAQPAGHTDDPEWPRLHPPYVQCVEARR